MYSVPTAPFSNVWIEGVNVVVRNAFMEKQDGPFFAFRLMASAEAEKYFEWYTSTALVRLREFERIVVDRRGPVLDFSEQSMADLGAWLIDVVGEGAREAPIPVWAPSGDHFPGRVSSEGLWLLDGAALYFAEALRMRYPHLGWMLNREKTDAMYQHTMLVGFGADGAYRLAPIIPIMKVFSARLEEPPDGEWLVQLYRVWMGHAAGAQGSVSAKETQTLIDEVEVTAIEGGQDWDAEIWVPDSAEAVLGESIFRDLPNRFAQIKGVKELVWEDREVFLVKLARRVDLKLLEKRVAEVMLRAEADAEHDETGTE